MTPRPKSRPTARVLPRLTPLRLVSLPISPIPVITHVKLDTYDAEKDSPCNYEGDSVLSNTSQNCVFGSDCPNPAHNIYQPCY